VRAANKNKSMKKNTAPTTRMTEETFSAVIVVIMFLLLPQLGCIAMVIGSVVGLALYVGLFPDRFRTRNGSLKLAMGLVSLLAIAVAVVVFMSLTHQFR